MSKSINRRVSAIASTSWIAIGVAMACSGAAHAQTTAAAPAPAVDQVEEVVVVGARASQQSSNDRKRRAKTPTDSIVADDIGSFPDRNVNEAISRIAGVALARNDFGEGDGVSIRGNGPDQTRVELDGMGVQSTYGLALTNSIENGGGRGADMRELSADLIKSVDVVKGSTADMTEGSLGGSVLIKTRTGLDFRKPYFSLRVGAEQNSLGKKWTPDINVVASRKFFDDRLGVVLTGSYRAVQTTGHTQETVTSSNQDYLRLFDWDNSAQKTFAFNTAALAGAAANVVLTDSVGLETPFTLVSKSAAAQTKVDCLNTFPFLATGTDAQKNQRINEQTTCLNQWNDYTPSFIRTFMNSQTDERKSIDLRFDYRISDTLTAYIKVNRSDRITDDQNRSRNAGGAGISLLPANRYDAAPPANGLGATTTNPYQRIINSNATFTAPDSPTAYQQFFVWTRDTLYPDLPPSATNPMLGRTGLLGTGTTPTFRSTAPGTGTNPFQSAPIRGVIVNVDPNSVTVDANHNVTGYTLYNANVNIDQIDNTQPSKTYYAQVGANYAGERMRIDFMAGMTEGTSSRVDMRTSRNYNYGKAIMTLQPSGLWNTETPAGYDETNPANYVIVNTPIAATSINNTRSSGNPMGAYFPAYSIAEQPLTSNNFQIVMRPRLSEASEKTAQIDLTYDTTDLVPFFTQFKTGFKYRKQDSAVWGGGSTTIKEQTNGNFSAFQTAATNDGDARRSSSAGFQNDLSIDTQTNYNLNIAAGWRPPVIIPGANVTGNIRACVETAQSELIDDGIAGAANATSPGSGTLGRCNYGFVQNTDFGGSRSGTETLTPAELQALITATLEENGMIPFDGYPGSEMMAGWQGIRTGELFRRTGVGQFANLDCMKRCVASDGNVYDQSVQRGDEETMNLYGMVDFEQENLPFGMTFNGNIGLRGVRTNSVGIGAMTLNITRDNAGSVTTETFRQNVQLRSIQTDWLPSYNLNLWVIPDKLVARYYTARTVSRPRLSNLLPAGTCNIDERIDTSADTDDDPSAVANTCTGRIGNPALSPFTAKNRNISVEWYPNRDTSFSLAWQKQDTIIGNPLNVQARGFLFNGSGQVDPVTGESIDNLLFDYPTFQDGPGNERTGWEFSAKTAFSFLPWLFRYTGADYNTSTLSTSNQSLPTRDPDTGDIMPPNGESAYFDNISLWYDDGRTNARISYQARGERFENILPGSNNDNQRNFPGNNLPNVGMPYNPGSPRFNYATKYIDAKISHNLSPNLQVYLEGRNLTKEDQILGSLDYRPFAKDPVTGVQPPKVYKVGYGGKRVATGFTYKFQ